MSKSNTPNTFYLNEQLNKWVLVLPADKHLDGYKYLTQFCKDIRVSRNNTIVKFLLNDAPIQLVVTLRRKYEQPAPVAVVPTVKEVEAVVVDDTPEAPAEIPTGIAYVPHNGVSGCLVIGGSLTAKTTELVAKLKSVTAGTVATDTCSYYALDFTHSPQLISEVSAIGLSPEFLEVALDDLVNHDDYMSDTGVPNATCRLCLEIVESALKSSVAEVMTVKTRVLKSCAKQWGMENVNSVKKQVIAEFVHTNLSPDGLSKLLERSAKA